MASLVVFGGGFFVARSSSLENEEVTEDLTWAVLICKNTDIVLIASRSSETWDELFSSRRRSTRLALESEGPAVSREKKFLIDGPEEVFSALLKADVTDEKTEPTVCFHPTIAIYLASICTLWRSTLVILKIPSAVLVSISRGNFNAVQGAAFLDRVRMFQSSSQSSIVSSPTKVRLVARNLESDKRSGTGVLLLL